MKTALKISHFKLKQALLQFGTVKKLFEPCLINFLLSGRKWRHSIPFSLPLKHLRQNRLIRYVTLPCVQTTEASERDLGCQDFSDLFWKSKKWAESFSKLSRGPPLRLDCSMGVLDLVLFLPAEVVSGNLRSYLCHSLGCFLCLHCSFSLALFCLLRRLQIYLLVFSSLKFLTNFYCLWLLN